MSTVTKTVNKVTLATGERLGVTTHAIERFDERVCGGVGAGPASERLAGMLATVAVESAKPAWVLDDNYSDTERYLLIGDDIALPICNDTIITVLARGYLSDHARDRRNAHRRSVRRSARTARSNGARYGVSATPRPYRRERADWVSAA